MAFGIADLILSALSLSLIAAAGLAGLRLVRAGPAAESQDEMLSDGAVVIADGGRITRLAAGARRLLGDVTGEPLGAAFARILAENRDEALGALDRLERMGEPVRLLTGDRAGRTLELDGAPEGGRIRVVLRDARLLEQRIAAAEAGLAEREAALAARLREREALAALLDDAPLIVWSRDADGAPRWSGGRIAASAGTVTAAEILPLLPAPQAAEGTVTRGASGGTQLEVTLAPGRSAALHAAEVPAEDGGRHGFAVDASLASAAERTLGRFVQTMTETFAHLTIGLAIFDRNQTLALFNPALVQMWQVDAAWLARRPSLREILEAMRANRRIPEAEDFHDWRRGLLALFDDPERVEYEELWHLSDGSDIRVLARPHPHGSLAFVFDDVTERMRLEQRFQRSIELRRVTLDRLDEGVAAFTPDGILQFVNSAFHSIWGTDPGALGRAEHARDVVRICAAASVEADVWERVLGFITADEERRPWSTRVTLGSGRILSVRVAALPGGSSMLVCSDISDSERIAAALRERNEALEAAGEMRTAVLDRISHRLRTPLNDIFGFAGLITSRGETGLTGKQREWADGILEAAGQLLDTIDDVTELAALQIEPLHDETAPLRVWEALELTAGLLRERALAAGATLDVAEAPDGAVHLVSALPTLRQIIFGTVAEALQRAQHGSRIELVARASGETVLEIATRETGGRPTADGGDGPTRPVLERMVAQAGGSYRVEPGPGAGEVRGICLLPGALAGGEDEPAELPPDADPPELIDGDPGDGE